MQEGRERYSPVAQGLEGQDTGQGCCMEARSGRFFRGKETGKLPGQDHIQHPEGIRGIPQGRRQGKHPGAVRAGSAGTVRPADQILPGQGRQGIGKDGIIRGRRFSGKWKSFQVGKFEA